jgi:putative transposase
MPSGPRLNPLLPTPDQSHPLGCHRPRIPDRICLEAMLIRLVTGCSWVDAEHLVGGSIGHHTAGPAGRMEIGVFERLIDEVLRAYDKIIGLDLTETAVDGSQHKAPMGGEGTGPNPTDRENRAGSGPCSPIGTASHSAGPPTRPTDTTLSCSPRHWRLPEVGASVTSKPCTSTVAMTPATSGLAVASWV